MCVCVSVCVREFCDASFFFPESWATRHGLCIQICMYIHLCIYIHVYMFIRVYIYSPVTEKIYICMFRPTHTHTHTCDRKIHTARFYEPTWTVVIRWCVGPTFASQALTSSLLWGIMLSPCPRDRVQYPQPPPTRAYPCPWLP